MPYGFRQRELCKSRPFRAHSRELDASLAPVEHVVAERLRETESADREYLLVVGSSIDPVPTIRKTPRERLVDRRGSRVEVPRSFQAALGPHSKQLAARATDD